MIRDNRRINIETNFFDDDDIDYIINKPHEETFETSLLNKDKGAIALYNTLDTIRLHRIISTFNILNSPEKIKIRKYSSKQILLPNRSAQRIGPSFVNQKNFKIKINQEQVDQSQIKRPRSIFQNKKKQQSLIGQVRSQSQYLRQSRKKILQSINRTFDGKYLDKSKDKSINNQQTKKILKRQEQLPKGININEVKIQQNDHIKNRIKKLEKLMKNIRRQKQRNEPIVIHKKTQVTEIPKQQSSKSQMHTFIYEIQSLRKQMHEIKKINEEILHHSRQRSLASSRTVTKSDTHVLPQALKSLNYKNIKRSQVIDSSQKNSSKPNSNNSNKINQIPPNIPRQNRLEQRANNRKKSVEKQDSRDIKQSKAPFKEKKAQLSTEKAQRYTKIQNKQVNPIKKQQKIVQENKNLVEMKIKSQSKKISNSNLEKHNERRPINPSQQQYVQKQIAHNHYHPSQQNTQKLYEQKLENTLTNLERQPIKNYDYMPSDKLKQHSKNQILDHKISKKPQEQYKLSPWYKEYGSPSYIVKVNTNSTYNQFNNNQLHNYATYQPELAGLSQIKDAVSNSNVNSSSYTSSPKSGNIGTDFVSINNFKNANYNEVDAKGQFENNYNYYIPPSSNNYASADSQYTNPDLLKQLNIGPFPKQQSASPQKSNIYKNSPQQHHDFTYQSPSKNYDNDYSNYNFNQKWNSFKTLSDGNSIGSYTYSKGSSVATSMAKLEQQYQNIINSNAAIVKGGLISENPTYQNYNSTYENKNQEARNSIDLQKMQQNINKYLSNLKSDQYEYNWKSSLNYSQPNTSAHPTESNYHQFFDTYAKND